MSEEQLWSIPDDVESIYIHYTTEDLLKGFREEALRHREEIERLNNIINKAIYFLKENACIDEDVEYFCDDLRYDDCKKLLEILKGSDKE